jgi:hypothetical protein
MNLHAGVFTRHREAHFSGTIENPSPPGLWKQRKAARGAGGGRAGGGGEPVSERLWETPGRGLGGGRFPRGRRADCGKRRGGRRSEAQRSGASRSGSRFPRAARRPRQPRRFPQPMRALGGKVWGSVRVFVAACT